MSAKDNKSEVQLFYKNSKLNFLLDVMLFVSTKGF